MGQQLHGNCTKMTGMSWPPCTYARPLVVFYCVRHPSPPDGPHKRWCDLVCKDLKSWKLLGIRRQQSIEIGGITCGIRNSTTGYEVHMWYLHVVTVFKEILIKSAINVETKDQSKNINNVVQYVQSVKSVSYSYGGLTVHKCIGWHLLFTLLLLNGGCAGQPAEIQFVCVHVCVCVYYVYVCRCGIIYRKWQSWVWHNLNLANQHAKYVGR